MQIGHIRVQNYRSLNDIDVAFSRFACVIGENNAGKSSLLHALNGFLKRSQLDSEDFYDTDEEIVITLRFDMVSDEDLEVLAEEHRTRANDIIHDGSLTLVKRFAHGEKALLRCKRLLPKEMRFREQTYTERFKKKKQAEIREIIELEYEEVMPGNDLREITTQTKARELIASYVNRLPDEAFLLAEADLPSGIPNSVTKLFPEPVYIEAVKNLSDDVKTTQQATFGKLLGILLEAIEPELSETKELFLELQRRLNRINAPDGTEVDERLPDVKRIEELIQRHLRETFADVAVELAIPPPDLKSILGNASVRLDDGAVGDAATKGDGLRRAVTFAIFRSLAELSSDRSGSSAVRGNRFLFLFEEPELYLHPIAQANLFDALSLISQQHQVVLTTHSPYFFRHDNTDRFIRMSKIDASPKPVAQRVQVDLSAWEYRDLFQMISFETSNSAFFSNRVVLVEGDSELITLPHIASLLHNEWDFAKRHISLVKTEGKGRIARFRQFFDHFHIETVIIADLDILEHGFTQLNVDENVRETHSRLLQIVDAVVEDRTSAGDLIPHGKAKDRVARGDQQAMWEKVKKDVADYDNGETEPSILIDSLNEYLRPLRKVRRRDVLKDHNAVEILNLKRQLLAQLRTQDIYVWEQGSIDDYFPASIGPKNIKPERAYNFCREFDSREQLNSLCGQLQHNGRNMSEFEVVFSSIFDETAETQLGSEDPMRQ